MSAIQLVWLIAAYVAIVVNIRRYQKIKNQFNYKVIAVSASLVGISLFAFEGGLTLDIIKVPG